MNHFESETQYLYKWWCGTYNDVWNQPNKINIQVPSFISIWFERNTYIYICIYIYRWWKWFILKKPNDGHQCGVFQSYNWSYDCEPWLFATEMAILSTVKQCKINAGLYSFSGTRNKSHERSPRNDTTVHHSAEKKRTSHRSDLAGEEYIAGVAIPWWSRDNHTPWC